MGVAVWVQSIVMSMSVCLSVCSLFVLFFNATEVPNSSHFVGYFIHDGSGLPVFGSYSLTGASSHVLARIGISHAIVHRLPRGQP